MTDATGKVERIAAEIVRRILSKVEGKYTGQVRLSLEVNVSQGGVGEAFIEEQTRDRLK